MTRSPFDELSRKHGQDVFRACLAFAAGDRSWARKRTYEVLLEVATTPEVWTDVAFPGWLEQIVVKHCAAAMRRGVSPGPEAAALERKVAKLPAEQGALAAAVLFGGRGTDRALTLMGLTAGQGTPLRDTVEAALRADGWRSLHDAASQPEAVRVRERLADSALSPAELVTLSQDVYAGLRRAGSPLRWVSRAAAGVAAAALVVTLGLLALRSTRAWYAVVEGAACVHGEPEGLRVAADCATNPVVALGEDRVTLAPGTRLQRLSSDGLRLVQGRARFTVAGRAPSAAPLAVAVSHGELLTRDAVLTVTQGEHAGAAVIERGSVTQKVQGAPAAEAREGARLSWPPSAPAAE